MTPTTLIPLQNVILFSPSSNVKPSSKICNACESHKKQVFILKVVEVGS